MSDAGATEIALVEVHVGVGLLEVVGERNSDRAVGDGRLQLQRRRRAPAAAITMAHGFSGLKYRGLQRYAERFAEAGFTVVVITWLRALPDHAQARIGIWGTSYAGGQAMVLGATDARIAVVVTQVPIASGFEQSLRRATVLSG